MFADFLAVAQALIEAGGWTVTVLLVALFVWAIRKGWLVWDWQYRDKADQVKELALTVQRLSVQLERERRRRRQDPPVGPS